MTLALILVTIGLILMLLEVFVIPGIGFAGIAGIVFTIVGVVFAFNHNMNQGWVVLGVTCVLSGFILWKSLHANTWDRFALHSEIDGKSHEDNFDLTIGDVGKTITRLNPMGKARVNEKVYEVTAQNSFIDEQVEVQIISLTTNKIIVKPYEYSQST